jgi:hypothetical protein
VMPARSAAPIERSINVDTLQQHHELGCRVTNEGGVSLAPFPEKQ